MTGAVAQPVAILLAFTAAVGWAGAIVYHERIDGGLARVIVEAASSLAAIWGISRLAGLSAAVAAEREMVPAEP